MPDLYPNRDNRGLRPGQTTSTSWKPGECPNPGGRPKKTPEVREFERKCFEYSKESPDVWRACMNDEEASWKDRNEAAEKLVIHDRGKAVDRLAVQTMNGSAATPATMDLDVLISRAEKMIGHESDD